MDRFFTFREVGVFAAILVFAVAGRGEPPRPISLRSTVDHVQPMTGIVLWSGNAAAADAPIQLEFSYVSYSQIVGEQGVFDWSPVETRLESAADRGHQMVLRFHDTYVGKRTGVPVSITGQPGYRITRGLSEGRETEFPDWSHAGLQRFVIDFFERFAARYDRDPRLAFVQVGFGLWAEYHIYDGPMELGRTFPSMEFQTRFARHLAETFSATPWMISVDAAGPWAPFAGNEPLLALPFGVFDDSLNHRRHREENEPNWDVLSRDRWQRAPAGGEFSFFEKVDQRMALSTGGPHGVPFERHARDFRLSFVIGDDQPTFQTPERIRTAGLACGYRFRVTRFDASTDASIVVIENVGIAPIYYDAYPAVDGVRSAVSLKALLPGERSTHSISAGGRRPRLTIECDRLVPGQSIGFEADLQ